MFVAKEQKSEHRKYLSIFLITLLKKRKGGKMFPRFVDHFNQVVQEAKAVYTDPKGAGITMKVTPSANYLAGRMMIYKDLEQEILAIDSIDDVDEEAATRILERLEPLYARA